MISRSSKFTWNPLHKSSRSNDSYYPLFLKPYKFTCLSHCWVNVLNMGLQNYIGKMEKKTRQENNGCPKNYQEQYNAKLYRNMSFEPRHEIKSWSACLKDQHLTTWQTITFEPTIKNKSCSACMTTWQHTSMNIWTFLRIVNNAGW